MSARTPAKAFESMTTFGDLLRYLRRRAGLTQTELSIAVGYSHGQISRLEQNQRPPDLATIAARFIPALHLDDEPALQTRLLELAAPGSLLAKARSSVSPSQHNLPHQLTSFIGRGREVAALAQLLSAGGLVTVTGPGGVGKTRLACQAAGTLLDDFVDGVWFPVLKPWSNSCWRRTSCWCWITANI
jgi:hypothetical protein